MRRKSHRTIWLTFLTSLVLIVSSVVNSTPFMTFSMLSDSMVTAEPHCAGMSHTADTEHAEHSAQQPSGCDHEMTMAHSCCTATCSTAFVLPVQYQPFPLKSQFALRPAESVVSVVYTAQSLYRPPIA
ncbi:hypothetical protein [Photobacterium sp. TLY01]|uniref:hypothetical protein n=1 Tax=Photobacterium sp. TLY01 TaxID=2907534 RepID=UPI001F2F7641|nr:hypothetical protein [Photobacterium sp. TLY01]UIP26796.1 hypothetical protein LN341_09060 [Photobacterium sp. TLY01]